MQRLTTQDRRLIAVIVLALMLLLALAVPAYLSMLEQSNYDDWVAHTHKVERTLQQMLAEMTDAETAGRGYVITRDEEYLAPYQVALRGLPEHFRAAHELTQDNPLQQERLRQFDLTMQQRLAIIAAGVQAQSQHLDNRVQIIARENSGKRLHDLARHQVATMLATEQDLLVKRRVAARANTQRYVVMSSAGMLLALLLIGLVLYRLWRELHQRRSIEAALSAAYAELFSANAIRNAILDCAPYSVISTDVNGVISTFNKAAERMLWYSADEMTGKTLEAFHDLDEVAAHAQALSQELGYAVPAGTETFFAKAKVQLQDDSEWTYIRKNGSRFPVRLVVTALRDEDNRVTGYLGIAYDITEEKQARDYIQHLALHDALTGLPNRMLFNDRVAMAIAQQRRSNLPFAVGMIDIDHFKHINDSMGHHIGDKLLQEFATRLKFCLRPTDILARMGGDEFVLLLPDTNVDGARVVADRILHALKTPINITVKMLHISASIGFSFYPDDGQSVSDLLHCADMAMYVAKKQGRNGFRIYDLVR